MRTPLILCLMMTGNVAAAHPGHLADLAGHDHWVAGAALGIAILSGLYGALKGKKEAEEADAEPNEEEVPA